jgi:hypothetical protein
LFHHCFSDETEVAAGRGHRYSRINPTFFEMSAA